MPVSVVCDNVNAAIRDSIANSSANSTSCGGLAGQSDDQQSLQSKLVASAKRVLLTKVEYEEVSNYNSSFLDNLKSKYMILKPSPPTVGKPSQNVQGDKEANQISSASPSSNATSYNTKDAHLPNPKKILFPRENVQIGWRSSGRKWNVGAGMVNVGNTCYLNSTLQALFHVPAMANWLVSDSAHRDKCEDENGTQGGCIICAMSKTLLHSQQSQCPIRPHLVYTKLRMVCKHLIMGRQEDAHEFLRYLVEAMEKSYLARFRNSKELDQYSKETTPLNQILGGYLRSAVRCLACGHISTTFQHFEDLLLDIRKANTLDEALEGYFARERLEDMGYKCESCKKKVAATKQFSLERAPISLCIQLKRFSMIGAKLNKHVGIRTRLDLTPYATKKNSEPLIYRLVSMVTHIGSSQHCGHYTAIGLTESGTYYHFDDSSVRAYAMQNVLNTSAYIIFYELEDSPQRSRQTSTITSREYYEQLKDAGKLNGVTENNDISRQYSSPSTSSSNPMHALNAKVLSKLETSTPGAFIGPQLPDKTSSTYKENSDSHSTITNSNAQPTLNGDVSKPKPNRYYLNSALSKIVNTVNKQVLTNDSSTMSNGTNGATNNNTHAQVTSTTSPSSSMSQKPNQNIVDKLLNHLKAGSTPATNDNATSSSNSSKINGTNHELTDFFSKKSNTNDFNHNTKTESPVKNGDSLTHNGSNNNKTFSHKPDSPVLKEKTMKDRRSETPTKSNGNCLNTSTSSTINTSSMNSSFAEHSKSSIKSLVPYETDDEENDDDEDIDASEDSDAASSSSKKQNRKNCVAIKRSKVSNHSYNSDNESSSSFESYSSISRKKLATPSPPVVESKTGYWQVETISTPNQSLLSSSSTAATPTPDKDKKNSFHSTPSPTAISPDNFYSSSPLKHKEKNKQTNHKMNGSNGNHHLNGDNEVVNELSKLSHRGYGAPVLSWNGHKSNMDKEVNEEKRLERKRELEEDEENEMDRGKQKKIKIHGPAGRDNPGYNPFQEYQSQYQNSNNRRWNNGHSNNGRYHNGHVYRQNPHHNHHHHHHHHHNNRNHNNFRRHRFHQRPHHQRNGDSNSYHRRDS